MTIYRSVDMFLAELSRRGCTPSTLNTYRRPLNKLGDMFPHVDVEELTHIMVRRFIDQWANAAPATSAQIISILHAFFGWLEEEGIIPSDPSSRLKRPKLARYDERDDIASISTADARRILDAATGWREVLAIHLLAYTGSRRHAIAQLRLRDYDPGEGTLVFREKGAKTIRKPVAAELRAKLDAALASGLYDSPADYLIPSLKEQRREGDRDDRFLLKLVQDVAKRVGVHATVHAFRAAFAVWFLESKPDKLVALQLLLGHASPETTRHYLRRLDRMRMMDEVRDLVWNSERLGRDSNAGDAFTPDGLASRSFRPLRHPAGTFSALPDGDFAGAEPSFRANADSVTDCSHRDVLGELLRGEPTEDEPNLLLDLLAALPSEDAQAPKGTAN